MSNAQDTATATYTPWRLARMGGVSDPDSLTSPGAVWLLRLVGAAIEIRSRSEASARDNAGPGDDRWDEISAAADSAVPVYAYEKWQVFVDLGAWQVGISEWGAEFTDMDTASNVALYVTAEAVITALLQDFDDRS